MQRTKQPTVNKLHCGYEFLVIEEIESLRILCYKGYTPHVGGTYTEF